MDLISNLYIWWKDFWSSSLVTAPRAQLWFYSHLCLCVIHKIFVSEAILEYLCLPSEDWVWRWCGCLNCMFSGSARYAGKPVTTGAENTPLFFLESGQLCSSEDREWRWHSCLDCRDHCTKCPEKPAATDTWNMVLLEYFSSRLQLMFKWSLWLVLLYFSVQQTHVLVPSQCMFQWTYIPIWCMKGHGMNCLCDSLFIKTLRDQLLHFLTASNASPLSQLIALMCDVHSCFSFPTLQVQIWSSLLSFFFFFFHLSSYWVLHGTTYSFLVVRDSCQLSAGAMWDLLYLKMYFWCICCERCTPHPSIPPPSFPLQDFSCILR